MRFIFSILGCLITVSALAAPRSPEELARRTQVVLDAFHVPEIHSADPLLDKLDSTTSLHTVHSRLPYLDPKSAHEKLVQESPGLLRFFEYPGAWSLPDFEIRLNTEHASHPPLRGRLAPHPGGSLQGVRILIDPGHAGSNEWSRVTGKWVRRRRGPRLNEGLLTLATSWALRHQLTARGAEVQVTRRDLGPALQTPEEDLNYPLAARMTLRDEVLQPWFRHILYAARDDQDLIRRFRRSREVRSLFARNKHKPYVMSRFDLWERSNQIHEFNPDLVLVLHYDAAVRSGNMHGLQNQINAVKAYIPGGFQPDEIHTREDRLFFAWHLTHATLWDQSRALARNIIHTLSNATGLSPQVRHGSRGTLVEPGVFARNLFLTRSTLSSPVVYLECAHYNHEDEYDRLIERTETVSTPSGPLSISPRELQIAEAIASAL